MHDLRDSPWPQLGDPTLRMLRRVDRALRDLWEDPHVYYSYYRRAARPNELFFVYRAQDRRDLRERVARWQSERRREASESGEPPLEGME